MNKTSLTSILLMGSMIWAGGVEAELVVRNWVSRTTYANNYDSGWGVGLPVPDVDGYGAGWQVDIALAGSHPGLPSLVEHAGTDVMYGWYDGYGYYIGGFRFDAYEGETVVMRIFNATDRSHATHYLDSLPVTLPDLSEAYPPHPLDLDVTFEFIPEPSSMSMIGLVCGCAVFVRRVFAA